MTGRVRRGSGALPTSLSSGGLAAFAWLADLGLPRPTSPWFAEIAIDLVAPTDTRFHLNVYSEEWGVYFVHEAKVSWIRVTDIAFAHAQRDDFALLTAMPPLAQIGTLLGSLESTYHLRFARDRADVATDLGEPAHAAIVRWVAAL